MKNPSSLSILYVVREKYPTFRVDLTDLFSAGIVKRGHSIDWFMQGERQGPYRTEQLSPRERVFIGPATKGTGLVGKFLNQCFAIAHDLSLSRIIKSGSYDFVQVRDKPFAAFLAMHATRKLSIPFFYWMSFPYPEADLLRIRELGHKFSLPQRLFYRVRGYLTDWILYKVVLPKADHIFVQSDRMKKDIAERGIDCKKATPVPMGINLDRFHLDQIQPACDPRLSERLPVVYVGTLDHLRNIDFLLHVLGGLRTRVPNAVLVLVGDAPEADMKFLRDETERLQLQDYVVFTGFLPMEAAWQYIRSAAACVSFFRPCPVLDSTTPTKIVEYLAWERPVVANDHPDQSKVLGESGGGLIVPYEVGSFVTALAWILENPAEAQNMGRAGRAYVVKHRAYKTLVRNLEQKYQSLLSEAQDKQKHQITI